MRSGCCGVCLHILLREGLSIYGSASQRLGVGDGGYSQAGTLRCGWARNGRFWVRWVWRSSYVPFRMYGHDLHSRRDPNSVGKFSYLDVQNSATCVPHPAFYLPVSHSQLHATNQPTAADSVRFKTPTVESPSSGLPDHQSPQSSCTTAPWPEDPPIRTRQPRTTRAEASVASVLVQRTVQPCPT